MMEKTIEESKQGESLVLEQKAENTKKLYIESYGCAMNFSDSEIVASILMNEGYNTTQKLEEADLVLVNLKSPCTVEKENLLSLCRWSPFENHQFQSTITHTLVNGNLVFEKGKIFDAKKGKRILFAKER